MANKILLCIILFKVFINSGAANEIDFQFSGETIYCCSESAVDYRISGERSVCIDKDKNENYFHLVCNWRDEDVIFTNLDKTQHHPYNYCVLKELSTDNVTEIALCKRFSIPFDIPISRYFIRVSYIFLAITVVVYLWTKTLRAPDDIAFITATGCLTVFMFMSEFLQFRSIFIQLFVYMVYFYFGGSFFLWFQVLMLIQLKTNKSSEPLSKEWMKYLNVYASGTPLLLMFSAFWIPTIYVDALKLFIFGSCVANIVLFFTLVYHALKATKQINHYRLIKYKNCLYIKLFIVQFIPWTLEAFRLISGDIDYSHPSLVSQSQYDFFDYICASQGVLVFVIMVVLRHQVRRYYGGKTYLCIKFPDSWADSYHADEISILPNSRSCSIP